jgi:steroid delta-isomerase-like uncharacterized protein
MPAFDRRQLFLLGATGAAVSLAGMPARAADEARQASREIMRSYLEAWNAHDPGAVRKHFAEDVRYYDASTDKVQEGREEAMKNIVKSFLNAAPDCVWERKGEPVLAEDAFAFEWTFRGTNTGDWADGTKATGRPFEFRGLSIFRIADGKIAYQGDYYDALGFYRQLGLM